MVQAIRLPSKCESWVQTSVPLKKKKSSKTRQQVKRRVILVSMRKKGNSHKDELKLSGYKSRKTEFSSVSTNLTKCPKILYSTWQYQIK
jgi:hypothetical protein